MTDAPKFRHITPRLSNETIVARAELSRRSFKLFRFSLGVLGAILFLGSLFVIVYWLSGGLLK